MDALIQIEYHIYTSIWSVDNSHYNILLCMPLNEYIIYQLVMRVIRYPFGNVAFQNFFAWETHWKQLIQASRSFPPV